MRSCFIGINFSAARDALDRIWITFACARNDRLSVLSCFPLRQLASNGVNTPPELLVELISRAEYCVVGCDACFGIPAPFVHPSWQAWLLTYPRRIVDAEALRQLCRDQRRYTDRVARAPLAPGNLRIYRQTDAWLRNVLRALVLRRTADIAPFTPLSDSRPWLFEVCPAVTLRALGLPARTYKGQSGAHRATRERILAGLETLGVVVKASQQSVICEQSSGDALDSLIAAVTVWLVIEQGLALRALPEPAVVEGWIYVPLASRPLCNSR